MKTIDSDILIIGAGITGLSLASFLETDNYLIVDKDSEIGGYCKTTIRNGFVWDYSGHFFHFNNEEIKDYVLKNIECDIKTVKKKVIYHIKIDILIFHFKITYTNYPQMSLLSVYMTCTIVEMIRLIHLRIMLLIP